MKKFTLLLAVMATLVGSSAHAQSSSNSGKGASASSSAASGDFAWGIGLAGVAVIATVVGVTVASAVSSPYTFSH